MSLILWVAEHKRQVSKPNGFIDDTFGVQIHSPEVFFEPLKKEIPLHQFWMLILWEEL